MDLSRDPSVIASAAAEEVRALNHRTGNPAAYQNPSDISDVVNALATLAERLPQTLQQASAGLRRFEEDQAIRMDDGSDPSEEVTRALGALLNAEESLTIVCAFLKEAASPLSHMGGHFADLP
ncbi:hypothetical protein [Streptomyces sp. NPDC093589]|uniref:hypothetical protein n=1 Tax=Streptomyces sp. NPDC093589 TaxID=3366043 RepID=UPI003813CCBC